jgi:hypothetical protein
MGKPLGHTQWALPEGYIPSQSTGDPAPVPLDTDYASVFTSDVPIVVQHTRLDSRQAENALLSTLAFPVTS